MRSMLGCLVLLVAGCYGPSFKDCEVSCAGGSCPSGFSCVDAVCRMEGASGACGEVTPDTGPGIDADPATDMDGDGVANGVDNCPAKANPDQRDEDGDTKGDVCDPCPVPVLGGQGGDPDADPDGDDVGNACDPNPNTPGDKIYVFDSFAAAPATAIAAGTWSFSGGTATSNASAFLPSTLMWPQPTDANGNPLHMFIIAPLTIVTLQPGGYFGPFEQYAVNNGGTGCTIGTNPAGSGELAVTRIDASGSHSTLVSMPVPVAPGMTDLLGLIRSAGIYSCVNNATQLQAPGGTAGVPDRMMGLVVSQAKVSFDFIMIVTSP